MRNSSSPVIAEITELAPGACGVKGELSFGSANGLLKGLSWRVLNGNGTTLDLAGVKWADSAGVALLLELQRIAFQAGVQLRFMNFPDQLLAIARVAGVDKILADFTN